jgi:hypothetical protein
MTLKRKAWSAVFLVWVSSPVYGDTFQDRVALAKVAEAAPAYSQYENAMLNAAGPTLAGGMKHCFDSTKNPATAPFVLVADILPGGTATGIEVRPKTNVSTCFAAAIAALRFLSPPEYPGHRAYPIVFEMRVAK